MKQAQRANGDQGRPSVGAFDSGSTFVELLVAIVLIGTAVVGTLAALRATVIATTVERDHAKAQQWLQSAVGVIEGVNFADCGTLSLTPPDPGDDIQAAYQAAIDWDAATNPDGAKPPYGYTGGVITVGVPKVWDGEQFVDFGTQSQCYDDVLLRQQLVTIEVRSPDGGIVESVEIVKRDRPGGGP